MQNVANTEFASTPKGANLPHPKVIFVTSSVCVKQILSGKIPLCKGILVDLGSMIFKILGASTGEYKQLPINWRFFQNTVKFPDKFLQESRNLKLTNRYSILSHTK